jgi:Leucine-rich repeat (LRR) protein
VKLEEKTFKCTAWSSENHEVSWTTADNEDHRRTGCLFYEVTFNKDTKLNIEVNTERIKHPEVVTDDNVNIITFQSSSIPLIHPDLLAKFPNAKEIDVEFGSEFDLNELNNPIENCQNIKSLSLRFSGVTEISRNLFNDCKKLEKLAIKSNSLNDLPNGIFKNQPNLKDLELNGKSLKLRESLFEGFKKLSVLTLVSIDLSQVKPNIFKSLNIKSLIYNGEQSGLTFPIEYLNSHETLEELVIRLANMEQLSENFVPTLRSLSKLRVLYLSHNSITSVEAFVDLPNVEIIILRDNKIEEIPANAFKGCPRLSKLILFSNPIKTLRGDEFDQLTGLDHLDLTNTKIASIGPTTFQKLTTLETLYLNDLFKLKNTIISKEVFKNLQNLKMLGLRNNNIHAIDPEAFDNNHKLAFLDLKSNKCVDEMFVVPAIKVPNLTKIKKGLKKCFDNFATQ